MIEVYDYRDLSQKLGQFPIESGTVFYGINEAYSLNAGVRPQELKAANITFTPFTVFKYDGVFYRQKIFYAADVITGLHRIDAVDLLYADLIDLDGGEFDITGSIEQMLTLLFTGTLFSVGESESLGVFHLQVRNQNKQVILNRILELFNAEIERDGLTMSVKHRISHLIDDEVFELKKGVNVVSIEENIDTSIVITSLRYRDLSEVLEENQPPTIFTITSPNAHLYPPKQAYREFRTDAHFNAWTFLLSNDTPRGTRTVKVPFNFAIQRGFGYGGFGYGPFGGVGGEKERFVLGTQTRLYCEQIGVDLVERVVQITRDITGRDGDTYVLGQRPLSFREIFTEIDEIVEEIEETVSDLELDIPRLIDEKFNELEFSDIEELLDRVFVDERLPTAIQDIIDGMELERFGGHIIVDAPGYEFPRRRFLQFAGNVNITDREQDNTTTVHISGGYGGEHIILDSLPTQAQINTFATGSVVLVYNPDDPFVPLE